MVGSLIPAGVNASMRARCADVVAAVKVRNVWGFNTTPDHNNGRCLDFMIETEAEGDAVAAYLWQHRKRLGLELIIWNRRIRRTYWKYGIPPGVWAAYRGPSAHTDHNHAQFSAALFVPAKAQTVTAGSSAVGVYVVNVRPGATLLGNRNGRHIERRRGYVIRTGVRIATDAKGRRWLVTRAGWAYDLDYLTKKETK